VPIDDCRRSGGTTQPAPGSHSGAPDGPLVRLLWTGGWDSTFRLLSLISQHRCQVQPYYVIDRARSSWPIEIERIRQIWTICQECSNFPGAALPPIVIEKADIEPDAEITRQFKRLAERTKIISPQCEWLAWFAEQHGLHDLELAVERDAMTYRILRNHVLMAADPVRRYALRPDVDGDLAMFRYFRFPLFDIIKSDMEVLAKQQGFADILELSWFCFRPFAGRWPCGMCVPCRYTIYEGLARRVGWRGRLCFYTIGPLKRALPAAVKAFLQRYLPQRSRSS
jgi:hypothetical protein